MKTSHSMLRVFAIASLLVTAPGCQAFSPPKIDRRLILAASLAEKNPPPPHQGLQCWHYVKPPLLEAGVVDSLPGSTYAKEGIRELVDKYGFQEIPFGDPRKTPVGAILFYATGRKISQGHVEIHTPHGYLGDRLRRTYFKGLRVGNKFYKATLISVCVKYEKQKSSQKIKIAKKSQSHRPRI